MACGFLMVDEMKVQSGLVFNRTGKIIGFVASSSDMSTLRDMYVCPLCVLVSRGYSVCRSG